MWYYKSIGSFNRQGGKITIKAEASGLVSDEVSLTSIPVKVENGLSKFFPSEKLASRFDRGETPLTPFL